MLPVAGVLLSIAIAPLISPHGSHRFCGPVMPGWALAFVVPAGLTFGVGPITDTVLHTVLLESIPLLILPSALFTVAGNVRLAGTLRGTARHQSSGFHVSGNRSGCSSRASPRTRLIPAVCDLLQRLARLRHCRHEPDRHDRRSMPLVRPVLRANCNRKHRAQTTVSFVFLASNIGGALTPLGDPPLIVGFLQGVEFPWPQSRHPFAPMLLVTAVLLHIHHEIESRAAAARRTGSAGHRPARSRCASLGGLDIPLLLMMVLMEGLWHPGAVTFLERDIAIEVVVGDAPALAIAAFAIHAAPALLRDANRFIRGQMIEMAAASAAIVVTIIPALAILQPARERALAGPVPLTSDANGNPGPTMYPWLWQPLAPSAARPRPGPSSWTRMATCATRPTSWCARSPRSRATICPPSSAMSAGRRPSSFPTLRC
jgi:Na+/H+ antiporter NhaD/arsenite permease-like protein